MKYRTIGILTGGLLAALLTVSGPAIAADSASAEINKRAEDPNQWPAPGRENKLTRHSKLNESTRRTSKT